MPKKSELAKLKRQFAIERAQMKRKLAARGAKAKRRADQEELNKIAKSGPLMKDYMYIKVRIDCAKHFKLTEEVPPFHLCEIGKKDLEWERSPGLPWTCFGYKTRAAVVSDKDALQRIRRVWHLVKVTQDIRLPHSTFVRGEIEYPFTVYLQEACYAVPLMEAYSSLNIPLTCELDNVCDSCSKLFYGSSPPNVKNIPSWLIVEAFNILIVNMTLVRYQGGGVPHTELLYFGVYNGIIKYFINTPVRTHNGQVIYKTKGVPKGSAFAKLIITIVNWIVVNYCKRKYRKLIIEAFIQIIALEIEQRM